jgi:hypothetical protein
MHLGYGSPTIAGGNGFAERVSGLVSITGRQPAAAVR